MYLCTSKVKGITATMYIVVVGKDKGRLRDDNPKEIVFSSLLRRTTYTVHWIRNRLDKKQWVKQQHNKIRQQSIILKNGKNMDSCRDDLWVSIRVAMQNQQYVNSIQPSRYIWINTWTSISSPLYSQTAWQWSGPSTQEGRLIVLISGWITLR